MDQAELQEQNDVTDHMIDYLGSPFRWGGFYFGPPYHSYGGGLGLLLVILIVIILLKGVIVRGLTGRNKTCVH